ncbi:hypothetical protein STEG23_016198 [Scotinomys teguina]
MARKAGQWEEEEVAQSGEEEERRQPARKRRRRVTGIPCDPQVENCCAKGWIRKTSPSSYPLCLPAPPILSPDLLLAIQLLIRPPGVLDRWTHSQLPKLLPSGISTNTPLDPAIYKTQTFAPNPPIPLQLQQLPKTQNLPALIGLIVEYYSAVKINDIVKFADKWMKLENIILSEICISCERYAEPRNDSHFKALINPIINKAKVKEEMSKTKWDKEHPPL